ncbi:hypothetical protein PR048_031561 [Dryococelus australis]|uniref:Uncharacterized protein n=1 Tax=Dryococelus australis TaxID=614101 RepID=A0ABQ9G5M7_9NEOP|nr:hypothetical protein PR048_031561 [Dryococelus australis]
MEEMCENLLNLTEEMENPGEKEETTEVEDSLKKTKRGKVPGVDDLMVEIIRATGVIGLQWLYKVTRVVWIENMIADDWMRRVMKIEDCALIRGITLMCHWAKIWLQTLELYDRSDICKLCDGFYVCGEGLEQCKEKQDVKHPEESRSSRGNNKQPGKCR